MKKKSQLSSFDILVLTAELKEMLSGSFIDKVYQPTKSDLIIRITKPKNNKPTSNNNHEDSFGSKYQKINLIIKLGKYIYAEYKDKDVDTSTATRSNKKTPPRAFAMLLRKHLRNGKIRDIFQHEFDRIIIIKIKKREEYQLVIELFGDGNVILVSGGMIIQPLISQTWSYRTLRAGEEFSFPPARINPKTIDEQEFHEIIENSSKDLVRTLIMDLNIPGKYAEELCHLVAVDKNIKPTELSDDLRMELFKSMQTLFQSVENSPEPNLIYTSEAMIELIELMPIKLKVLEDCYFKRLDNYNSAVDLYFNAEAEAVAGESVQGQEDHLKRTEQVEAERARLLRQQQQQMAAIEKFSEEARINHELGEAIYTNYQLCEAILNEINALKSKATKDEILGQISNSDKISELNLKNEYVIVKIAKSESTQELNVKLNLRKDVIKNANKYYDRIKVVKEKLHGAQKAKEKSQNQLKKIEKEINKVKSQPEKKTRAKIIKHFWFEKYHWFISSRGNIVVAGRDAKSNDQVVKKYLKDKDRYCHSDMSGAASVVVKHNLEEPEIPEETLHQACEFAVVHSKAWNAKLGSGTAYWVKPDQVSKTPQTGEFLARGAFVIRGKRNHISNIKLQIAIGEIDYEGHYKLMAGPVSAVSTLAKSYIILMPGETKKNAIANQLSKIFNVSVDDILSLLPSGEFTIVEKIGINE